MRALGFSEELLGKRFKQNGTLGMDGSKLTRADRQLISIGRALIMVRFLFKMSTRLSSAPTQWFEARHTTNALC